MQPGEYTEWKGEEKREEWNKGNGMIGNKVSHWLSGVTGALEFPVQNIRLNFMNL